MVVKLIEPEFYDSRNDCLVGACAVPSSIGSCLRETAVGSPLKFDVIPLQSFLQTMTTTMTFAPIICLPVYNQDRKQLLYHDTSDLNVIYNCTKHVTKEQSFRVVIA